MKLLKKALFMASLMMLSIFLNISNAFAEESEPVISINAGYGAENNIAEVEVNIKNNAGLSAYSIEIEYNSELLEFVDGSMGDALSGGTFYCNGNYSYDSVRIVWSNSRNQKGDGTIALLRFKTANNTADIKTAVSIGYSMLGDDLTESTFSATNDELKIVKEINRGDVNKDNQINISDVVSINLYLLDNNANALNYSSQANAEVSGNKIVDTSDSMIILNYVAMITKEI